MTNRRWIENWETVAVTALPPGWRNVYRDDNGGLFTDHCPALLLQEHRSDTECWDEPQGDGQPARFSKREKARESPYQTRVVFAADQGGWLDDATEVANYAHTIGPGAEVPTS